MGQTDIPAWATGFDHAAIEKQASAQEILPRIDLPKAEGDVVNVKFTGEPFEVENEKLVDGKAWFVRAQAWKAEGSEIDGQILLAEGLMRELFVFMTRQKIRGMSGLKVKIFRQLYTHKTFGEVLGWRVAKI